jgi:RNA polymerase sigma-70 factor (ECF subfamily)
VSVQAAEIFVGPTRPPSQRTGNILTGQEHNSCVSDDMFASMLLRAQTGDTVAFDGLYEHFASPLFRYLCVRCDNVALAEDLTGEVWVRVVQRLPSFRIPAASPELAFRGWLYRIASNLVIDTYRRRSSQDVTIPETLMAGTPAPDEQVIAREEHGEVRAALDHLNEQQREVLVLRFVEEHSVAEVAHLTGRSAGAVRVMQYRALRTLAHWLQQRSSGVPDQSGQRADSDAEQPRRRVEQITSLVPF